VNEAMQAAGVESVSASAYVTVHELATATA